MYSNTGPVDRDYDDLRRFSDAGFAGVKRALAAGIILQINWRLSKIELISFFSVRAIICFIFTNITVQFKGDKKILVKN